MTYDIAPERILRALKPQEPKTLEQIRQMLCACPDADTRHLLGVRIAELIAAGLITDKVNPQGVKGVHYMLAPNVCRHCSGTRFAT